MLKNAFYIALFTLISWGSYQLSYPSNTPPDLFYDGVFMENIIKHVDKITQGPRAVGDYFHDDVQRYLVKELNSMGLEVSKQISTAFNPKNRTAAPIRNIIAKKNGTDSSRKGLMLLAHYDAAKFSGTGAGDDASGVAVILENLNAFIKTKQAQSNDIVVVFTDAEEIGLLGAHAFINEQLGNNNIGLIINLEARGSSGPVMMWPETVGGNKAMIEGFAAAKVPMPVTTSLHYEIYKMLPNDTDLTPFTELGQVNGFNLAFIGDHFNYHTQLDTLQNLSLNTLAHQSIQLQSLLKHFTQVDLSQMQSSDSLVYFSLPLIGLISYPVWLTWVLMAVFAVLLIWQLLTFKHRHTHQKSWLKTVSPVILASILAYAWCWLMLFIIDLFFPEYKDIMQGFPYQGRAIMTALLIGSAIVSMSVFGWFNRTQNERTSQQSTFNIFLWFIVLIPLVYYMPGSGLLVWPVLLSVILLIIQLHLPKVAEQLAPLFAVLTFILLGTLLINLPIAMGIAALPLTAVVLTWLLALFIPVISPVKKQYHAWLLLLLPVGYLTYVLSSTPSISQHHPHPTSLSYLYDVDSKQGHYFNYDVVQSGWNDAIFELSKDNDSIHNFRNLYKKPVRHLAQAEPVTELNAIGVQAKKPLGQGEHQLIDLIITANRDTEILEIYTNQAITLHKLSIEGRNAVLTEPIKLRANQRLLHYYFNGKKEINLSLAIEPNEVLDWQIQSHSLDLLSRPEFNITARPDNQIQKPFIKSDNITTVQSFTFGLD